MLFEEERQKNNEIIRRIRDKKILAVIRTDNADKAINISKALVAGGVNNIEITMGYDGDLRVIEELSAMSSVYVAAGSLITANQANCAIKAGAKLIVSPITEPGLIKTCKGRKIPIITGAATPTEAYRAWKLGVNLIKLFPAKDLGGATYLKDILTPMSFLNLLPTGGIEISDFISYLKAGAVAVGMGKSFYANEKNYLTITKKAELATEKIKTYIKESTTPKSFK